MICQPREEAGGQPHALQVVGDINPLARSIACIDNVSRAADHGRAARGHQGHVADVIDAAIALGHRFGQFAEPRHQPIIARFARKIARESLAPSRGQAVSFRPIAQTNGWPLLPNMSAPGMRIPSAITRAHDMYCTLSTQPAACRHGWQRAAEATAQRAPDGDPIAVP
jgi:hypothetical protein